MNRLPDVLVQEIADYGSLVDSLSVRVTNKRCRSALAWSRIQENFHRYTRQRLGVFFRYSTVVQPRPGGPRRLAQTAPAILEVQAPLPVCITLDEFLVACCQHGYWLGGSFAMQCLLAEEWPDSDIDLIRLVKCGTPPLHPDPSPLTNLLRKSFLDKHKVGYTGLPIHSQHFLLPHGKYLNLVGVHEGNCQSVPHQALPFSVHTQVGPAVVKVGTWRCFSVPEFLGRSDLGCCAVGLDLAVLVRPPDGPVQQSLLADPSDTDASTVTGRRGTGIETENSRRCGHGSLCLWHPNHLIERSTRMGLYKPLYTCDEEEGECALRYLHRALRRVQKYSGRGFSVRWHRQFAMELVQHMASCSDIRAGWTPLWFDRDIYWTREASMPFPLDFAGHAPRSQGVEFLSRFLDEGERFKRLPVTPPRLPGVFGFPVSPRVGLHLEPYRAWTDDLDIRDYFEKSFQDNTNALGIRRLAAGRFPDRCEILRNYRPKSRYLAREDGWWHEVRYRFPLSKRTWTSTINELWWVSLNG